MSKLHVCDGCGVQFSKPSNLKVFRVAKGDLFGTTYATEIEYELCAMCIKAVEKAIADCLYTRKTITEAIRKSI